mgnify:CR=1 FL=1
MTKLLVHRMWCIHFDKYRRHRRWEWAERVEDEVLTIQSKK